MENQKFCLTWKDYNTNFCKEFGEFRKHEDFFDVTLACEDNTITAHKLVLSASSDFFKTILRKHKHEHPLIYLTEVKFSDLQSILDFIYTGEAEVAEKDLESLLSTATRFKVKGLTDGIGGTGIGTEAVTMTTGIVNVDVAGSPIRKKIKTDIVLEEKRPRLLSPPQLKTTITPVFSSEATLTPTIIKSESLTGDGDSGLPRAVRTSAAATEPIDISSFLSPEEQQQFESEAQQHHATVAASGFPKTVSGSGSNVIDTAGVSQDYLNNKTELDRQCNELMVSSYDSSVGQYIVTIIFRCESISRTRGCQSLTNVKKGKT